MPDTGISTGLEILTTVGSDAPGGSGAYRMLHDDKLWRAVSPLVEGLNAFVERLDKPVDKPVSDYFGKPTSGP